MSREGLGVLLVVVCDGMLALLTLRANRPAESLDDEWFGNNMSWTNTFYVPVALAFGLLVLDLWDGL